MRDTSTLRTSLGLQNMKSCQASCAIIGSDRDISTDDAQIVAGCKGTSQHCVCGYPNRPGVHSTMQHVFRRDMNLWQSQSGVFKLPHKLILTWWDGIDFAIHYGHLH